MAGVSETALEPVRQGSDKGSLQRPGEMERNIHALEGVPLPAWGCASVLRPAAVRTGGRCDSQEQPLGEGEGLAGLTVNGQPTEAGTWGSSVNKAHAATDRSFTGSNTG